MAKVFVCFTGSDGSGKSTITGTIFDSILEKNKKTKKIYGRYRPLLTKHMTTIAKRFFLHSDNGVFSDYDGFLSTRRSLLKASSFISRVYLHTVIAEYILQITIKLTIPYRFGYSIICDRYIYDTIINDISLYAGLSVDETNDLLRKAWYFIPKPDIVFLLHVPEQVALQRKNDIPSLNYLRIRNKLYGEIASTQHFLFLDGMTDPSILRNTVLEKINRLLSN
jgi:thymidylate kinase